MEVKGFEPLASGLQSRRSSQLSYTPGATGSDTTPPAAAADAPLAAEAGGGGRTWTRTKDLRLIRAAL